MSEEITAENPPLEEPAPESGTVAGQPVTTARLAPEPPQGASEGDYSEGGYGENASNDEAPPWQSLSPLKRQAVLEALLFAADNPLPMKALREILGADRRTIKPILDRVQQSMVKAERGVYLAQVAGGYAIRTKVELSPWIRTLLSSRPRRLSRAAMETLAIIAYRQPITRAEVEEVRGVDSGGVVRSLLDRRLIRILGRKPDVGRPMIYGTTRTFLNTFGLKDLSTLPPLAEIKELDDQGVGPEEGATKVSLADVVAAVLPKPPEEDPQEGAPEAGVSGADEPGNK